MKLSNASSRFLITLLSLGIGVAVVLFSNFAPPVMVPQWIGQIDNSCVRAIFSSNTQTSEYHSDTQTIEVRTLGIHPDNSREFQGVVITDDPDHIFEATPPTPLDYAIILQQLYDKGYRSVVITTRMTWDKKSKSDALTQINTALSSHDEFDEIDLSAKALSYKLSQFDQSVIGLPVTRGASSQPLPPSLMRASIHLKQVHGNHSSIPRVNQITLPASIDGGNHSLAGFYRIENTPESTTHIALLALWGHENDERMIPSIELLTIMSAHGISPAELDVECGKSIRLGKTGPLIPIDEFGQTPNPRPAVADTSSSRPTNPNIKAEQLLARNKKPSANTKPAPNATNSANTLCLIHATGEKTTATNLLSAGKLTAIITLCETLPTPGDATPYRRLPVGFTLIIILALAIITSRFITLTPKHRHLAFSLTVPFIIILLLVLMKWDQQWFGLTAPVVTIFSAWILSSQFEPAK